MVWTKIAELRGVQGYSVADTSIDGDGHLQMILTDGSRRDAGSAVGPRGLDAAGAADDDAAVAAFMSTVGTVSRTTLDSLYKRVFKPAAYGATGDGSTDDTTALKALIVAAGGKPIQFERNLTYKVTDVLTFGGSVDLNGSTISSTKSVNVGAGTFENGTVTGPGSIKGTSLSGVTVRDVTLTATAVSSQGISMTSCTDVVVENCAVSGGSYRGVLVEKCDRFTIARNHISDVTDTAGYGILVTSAAGEVHGDGLIIGNTLNNCAYGVAVNGGEADSTKPAYNGQYTLRAVQILANRVYMPSPYAQHCGIWATCSTGVDISHNYINGSSDIGVDFEYCTNSNAVNNIITNVLSGGLAALFGCTDILFDGNNVSFDRTDVSGSAATAGVVWKGTSWKAVLLRDNPQRVTFRNNKFRSTNGSLGQVQLAPKAGNVTFTDNDFRNVYISGATAAYGDAIRVKVCDNEFTFSITINNPVIYVERQQEFYCDRNAIVLTAGDVLESNTRHYIAVYDASGTTSNFIFIRHNTINNGVSAGTGSGISVVTTTTGIHAHVIGNVADKIGVAALTYTAFTFDRNYKYNAVGVLGATRNDTTAAVTMPVVS